MIVIRIYLYICKTTTLAKTIETTEMERADRAYRFDSRRRHPVYFCLSVERR